MAAAADHDQQLLQKVQGLSNLELAALLSLVAREHCLISTSPEAVDELTEELRLVASRTFGLSSAVISCHAHTTLDDFATALLLVPSPQASSSTSNAGNASGRISPFRTRYQPPHHHHDTGGPSSGSYFLSNPRAAGGALSPASSSTAAASQTSHPQIANVILAKHLDRAPRAVQIQALELLRTRRIFTRTNIQTAPKQFLFVAVVGATSGGCAHVSPHLNDFFYLAHWHDPEEGFDYLDEEDESSADSDDDVASTSSSVSVVRQGSFASPPSGRRSVTSTRLYASVPHKQPVLSEADLVTLAQRSRQVHVNVDVTRYQMNVISFLRTHRAVGGGITPTATKHFEQLMRSLAPLHGLDFVTPSLVALAAKKVYLHRIKMVAPESERSMQWGSELQAIETILEGIGPEDVIEDVLGMVAAPS
ncbi:hypothetical protein OQA88_1899 [Cercophora sp. LCS_1]